MLYYKYKEFVTVTVKHSYYHDNLSRDFTFTPFPSTAALLNGFGLIPRVVDGSLVLYQQQEKNDVPVQPIDKITDLFFTVRVTSDILNITKSFKPGKYWLSNLNDDGSTSSLLTVKPQLSEEDTIPDYGKQKTILYFKKGTIKEIKVKKIFPHVGLQDIETYTINAFSVEQEIKMTEPGLYYIEKDLKSTKMILHDELESMGDFWAVLHLQLKPDDPPKELKLELVLKPLVKKWQYFVLEPKNRPLTFNPANLAFNYSKGTSRYPVGIIFSLITPVNDQHILKKQIEALKEDNKIKDVHVFESNLDIELVDGSSPVIEIKKAPGGGAEVLAKNISVPTRAMKETKIIYKL